MNKIKLLMSVSLVSTVFVLSGCSTTGESSKQASNTGANASGANSSGAQVYAAGNSQGYKEKIARKNSNGQIINSLKAPANQTYYFSFDSNNMDPSDLKALSMQATFLATHPDAKVRLEGNTDARGSREYNVGLGWRRDQSIARILEQQGVNPKQLEMVSYGKEKPAVFGSAESIWRLNRRVNLVYEAY